MYLKIDFWSRFIPDSVYKLEDSGKNSFMIKVGALEDPFKNEEFLSEGIPITKFTYIFNYIHKILNPGRYTIHNIAKTFTTV